MDKIYKVVVPRRLTSVTEILGMKLGILDLSKYESCEFDFTNCSFGEPLPMLLLACEIRLLFKNNNHLKITARSQKGEFRGYADHIGLFRFIGFDRGNSPGQALGSANYIPVQVVDLNKLREASAGRPYAEIVEEKSTELARILTQQQRGDLFSAIQYSLREMMRNSAEHSLGNSLVIFGQYWPAKSLADIVLFDTGVGIRATLSGSGIVVADDKLALLEAIKPGVSGVSETEMKYQDEQWRNSGFGLYVTSSFFAERGRFRIISGTAGLTCKGTTKTHHDWRFSGTCIQMVLDTSNIEGASKRILEIVSEGELQQDSDGGRVKKIASKSSKSVFF